MAAEMKSCAVANITIVIIIVANSYFNRPRDFNCP